MGIVGFVGGGGLSMGFNPPINENFSFFYNAIKFKGSLSHVERALCASFRVLRTF